MGYGKTILIPRSPHRENTRPTDVKSVTIYHFIINALNYIAYTINTHMLQGRVQRIV